MNQLMQALRGTRDLHGLECRKFRHVEQTAREISKLYGFQEIETPMIEAAHVFLRTLGDSSDMVTKEVYLFEDRGGDKIVLRPEGTAGVARAFINEGMAQQIPVKLFYRGPMFRYERPQKGRYRQFFQIGCELMGTDKPQADIEVILMGAQTLRELGLLNFGANNAHAAPESTSSIQLLINTIGDLESRARYREKLVEYFTARQSELSADSLVRLAKNPLRILDSKDAGDRKVVLDAPKFIGYLNDASKKFFDEVLEGLTLLGVPYKTDETLVRGIDYYCHTVFEFVSSNLGAQNAVLAGGRYDGLIQSMGGPATPGVGWGAGVDRLVLMLGDLPAEARAVSLVPMGDPAEKVCLQLLQELRSNRVAADMGYGGNIGKRMKRASERINSRFAIVVGDNELSRGIFVLKDLDQGTQSELTRDELLRALTQTK